MIKDTLAKEETNEDKKNNQKNKEISQEILKKMFGNLLKAVGIMLYFIILNLAYSAMEKERLVGDIEVFAGSFLIAGIIFLERAYKKDDNSIAITGIEFLFLSLHSLSIMHIITLFQYDFSLYLLTSSYIFSIYYVFKAIVLYTKGRKEYLNSLSDISEIVKKDEPVKKEAKKKNKELDEERKPEETTSDLKVKNEEVKKKKKTETKIKNTSKTKTEESKSGKKKVTSKRKTKSETVETPKVKETQNTKEKTTKSKHKEEKEENQKNSKTKSKMIKEEKAGESKNRKKKTTKAKTETVKEETEETKTPEKKRRGRPKKEVGLKND